MRNDLIWVVVIAAMYLVAVLCLCNSVALAGAEEPMTLYVLCDPESTVNIRRRADKDSPVDGWLMCGMQVTSDGTDGGWIHLISAGTESGEGWVDARYITTGQVTMEERDCVVTADGRVALRSGMEGRRVGWAKPGQELRVLAQADDWSVTESGYIRTEYLEGGGGQ